MKKIPSRHDFSTIFLLAAFCIILIFVGRTEGAYDYQAALEKGITLYEKGDFNSAIQEFRQLINEWKDAAKEDSNSEGLFTANLYVGMSYLGMGKEGAAKEFMTNAFRAAPYKTLSPDQYSPKVISLYNEVVSQNLSSVTVNANVPNAEVYIDNEKKGVAPVVARGLLPGRHTVKVVAKGQESVRTVDLQPESDSLVTFDFKSSGSISVSSEPSAASVYFNGRMLGTSPFLIKDVPAGEHVLRISKEGHLDNTQKVTVKENEVASVNVKLELVAYRVKISSTPDGADVFWDDVRKGKTPVLVENVGPGPHKIAISQEGYEDVRETVDVKTPATEKHYRLDPITGGINIKTEPPGAEVFIDNRSFGTTPLSVAALPVKQYFLSLRKEGYREKNITVIIARDKISEVQETLPEIDRQPPEIIFEPPAKAIKENKNIVSAKIVDNQTVGDIILMLKMEGEVTFQGIKMSSVIRSIYEAVIPEMYLRKGAVLEYYINACDMQNNCVSSGSRENPYKLKVISLEPYTEGFVLDADGDKSKVTISLGAADGIKKQDRYVVFRTGKELRQPKTGELLQIEEVYVGTIKVKELMPRTSYAYVDDAVIPIAKDDRIRKQVSAPAGVATEGNYATKIALRWTPNREPEVKGYRIYRSSKVDGSYKKIGEVEGRDNTVYEDTEGMMERLTYFYQIAAYNRFGTDGIMSEPVTGKTKKGVLPPENIWAEAVGVREIQLKWDTSKRDQDIEKYIIYRSEDQSGPFAEIAKLDRDVASFNDTGNLKDDRNYYYRIAGKSRYGSTGEQSATVSARTKDGPAAPQEVSAAGLVKTIKVQWKKHEDPAVAGYLVYRNDKESGTFTEIGKTGKTEFLDKDVIDGKLYFYMIASYYSVRGMEITGHASRPVAGALKSRPKSPDGLTAQSGLAKKIVLKWNRGVEDDLAEYWVYRGSGDKIEPTPAAKIKADVAEFADSDLKNNTRYVYAVRTVDKLGLESELSSVVAAVTKPLPAKPSGLQGRTDHGKIILNWSVNKEPDVTGYNVYKKGWLKGNLVSASKVNSFEMKLEENTKSLKVYITAIDKDGLESEPSEEVEISNK